MGDAGHVTPDVFTAVVDARILETEEGDLDELATAERHKASILGGDAKLEEIKLVDVLEERACVCEDLACRLATDAEIGVDEQLLNG